ncbi:hypothetical protein EF901_17150, partial [Staphylococcus aureus]
RDQSPTRANTNFINKDERFKSVKVCPLIYWTEDRTNIIRHCGRIILINAVI